MDMEYAGIAVVPLVIGLVELAKRMGLQTRWAAPLAVGLGLLASLGYRLSSALGGPGAEGWAEVVLLGLGLGLSAAGLYSGAKEVRREAG